MKRTACYVDQYDTHLPLLTVRETLLFARKCLWAAGAKDTGEEDLRRVIQQEAAEQGAGGRAALVRPVDILGLTGLLVQTNESHTERLTYTGGCRNGTRAGW